MMEQSVKETFRSESIEIANSSSFQHDDFIIFFGVNGERRGDNKNQGQRKINNHEK